MGRVMARHYICAVCDRRRLLVSGCLDSNSTKKNDYAICTKTWDLDYVAQNNSWTLVKYPVGTLEEQWFSSHEQGTVVRWDSLDRLAEVQSTETAVAKTRFFDRVTQAQWHLEMVFHHFLERGTSISINGHSLKPWNPFVTGPPPQPLSEEFCGVALIGVRPYVLPHHTKYEDKTLFTRAGGPKGWNEHQGFYIYRNDRLLVPGTWLGFYKKDEHCKLARIKVDISSELDAEWELDIKKSVARPPAEIRTELKRIGMTTRNEAQSVYRHRGLRTVKTKGIDRLFKVWNEQDRNTGRAYVINRNHPLIEDLKTISDGLWSSISSVFKLIEESLPITHIVMREAEDPDSNIPQYDGLSDTELIQIAKILQKPLVAQGLSLDQIKTHLILVEPFNYRPEILENL